MLTCNILFLSAYNEVSSTEMWSPCEAKNKVRVTGNQTNKQVSTKGWLVNYVKPKFDTVMKTQSKKQLNCPNCDSLLDVDQLLVTQFEDSIRKDLQSELDKRERDLKLKKEEFQKMSEALQQEREDINDLVSERVKSQLETREKAIKDAIRKEVNDEKVKQLEDLEA